MFVDDSPEILQLYDAIADKMAHRKVSCPIQALCNLQSSSARVIVTDHRMPGMTGKQFIASAKRLCPDATFIMVTGTPPDQFTEEERPHEVITKPFDPMALRRKLQGLLSA